MLDMPGVLWPKFEDQGVARKLAFTGAVKDDILAVSYTHLDINDDGSIDNNDIVLLRDYLTGKSDISGDRRRKK